MTNDIGFILAMDNENLSAFLNLMKELGYIPRLPVNPDLITDPKTLNKWITEKNLIAFSFYNEKENDKVVGIVVFHPLDFEKAFKNKKIRTIQSMDFFLVSRDDLITMKKASGRERDLNDIESLEKMVRLLGESND